ncbi:hypothetical protein [uncultured Rhodoblastus sp.]|uniref:hypothetical protein n=1 Tax=uncultured Rhodoblastus sp. TaxID=543037 RepID=UPI0025EB9C92|nr:hypothetical protein [uncultured Rhodoblastus sp.]
MNIKALLASLALLAVVGAPAHAGTIIFDSYSTAAGNPPVNSGTDAQGQPWSWGFSLGGNSAWGAPGIGLGENTFNTLTSYKANNFEISFVYFSTTGIDQTPSSGPGGYNDQTRFTSDVGGTLTAWTPVFDGTKVVGFHAPTGVFLSNGDTYFVNVVFNGGDLSGANAGYTAGFSYTTAVPEISTWAMMLAGFAGLGFAGYRRNKAVAVKA